MKRGKRFLPTRWIFVLIFILFSMGIGYATLETNLIIAGTSDIDSARWDIYFTNIRVTNGSVSSELPVITNKTAINFSANLENPGDFYEFKVDLVNDGTLDAKLESITILPVLTEAQKKYFRYTVTYEDGVSIDINDELKAETSETLLIRCEYLVQSDTSLYPTDDISLNFSVAFTYVQGDGNQVRRIVYLGPNNSSSVHIGSHIPSGVTQYETIEDAVNATQNAFGGNTLCFEVVEKNGVVVDEYLVVIVTSGLVSLHNEMTEGIYFLRSGGATLNTQTNIYNGDSIYYQKNKEKLTTAFSSTFCSTQNTLDGIEEYICDFTEGQISVLSDGQVLANDKYLGFGCYINSTMHCSVPSS